MALKFGDQKGSAKKAAFETFSAKDGDNDVRIVGDILPRYVYWVKGTNGKNIPFECLEFNRDEERFDRAEKDWVKVFFPDLKCSWSYMTQCIHEGQLKVFPLKKKLWEQIITAAEDLGDPTNIETGWNIKFKKVKTGPLPYNIEYQLQVLKCKPSPLAPEHRELIANLKSMDELIPRPTPEAQRTALEKIKAELAGEVTTSDAEMIADEFDIS